MEAALLWARSPRLFMALSLFYALVDRRTSPIPPAVRSLVMVRISQINHCPFCVDLNSAILLERGADPDKIENLHGWHGSPLYDEIERLVLEYAEAMTVAGRSVDDDLFGRLRTRFDDDALVELTALVAFQNLSSKFNSALDVPPRGLCRLPSGPNAAP